MFAYVCYRLFQFMSGLSTTKTQWQNIQDCNWMCLSTVCLLQSANLIRRGTFKVLKSSNKMLLASDANVFDTYERKPCPSRLAAATMAGCHWPTAQYVQVCGFYFFPLLSIGREKWIKYNSMTHAYKWDLISTAVFRTLSCMVNTHGLLEVTVWGSYQPDTSCENMSRICRTIYPINIVFLKFTKMAEDKTTSDSQASSHYNSAPSDVQSKTKFFGSSFERVLAGKNVHTCYNSNSEKLTV